MKESDPRPTLQIIGRIRSSLTNRETAPKQEFEGGVEARIEIFQEFQPAMEGLAPGKEILLLTWMHLAGREYLRVHPRGDAKRPMRGVFATRSPDRPNPIGLHRTRIVAISDDGELTVTPLEALDMTPVVDIKPVINYPRDDRGQNPHGG